MRTPAATPSIIQGLSLGADSVASDWGAGGVAGLLFSASGDGVEVFLRKDISLELCGSFSSGAGLELLRLARKVSRPHLLRQGRLASRAPAVQRFMAGDGLGSIALQPILGERSVLGYFLLGLPSEDEAFLEEAWGRAGASTGFNRWMEGLGREAGLAALKGLLGLQENGLGREVQALLVLDSEDRILLSHSMSRILPSWGSGEVTGQALKTLPGGKVLASLDPSGSGYLDWRTRKVPLFGGDGFLDLAAIPLRSSRDERLPWRALLLRSQEREHRQTEGALLLELTLRVAPDGAQKAEEDDGAGPLVRAALAAADRIQTEESVNLSGMFRGFLHRLEPELQDDRIRILPILDDELPLVRAHRGILGTALWSILRQAWAALLPRGGSITLRTWEEAGSIWCTISEDGEGIQDSMPALEPLELPGLGGELPGGYLEMARALLQRAGGVFHVETRKGLWTRYSVVFPSERVVRDARSLDHPGIPPAVKVRKTRNGQLAVLVVDDNQMVRTVLKKFLERKGHEVVEAVDGGVALEILQQRAFDRVMVDIDMPGTSGVEFFQQLDSVNPTMRDRTVFMTGGFQEGETEDFIRGTGRPHLSKPFDLSRIGDVLTS